MCGDIVAMLAQNAGCAALVLDGMVRDVVGLVEVGLPIFARGITPNSCVRSGPGRVGFPIVAGVSAVSSLAADLAEELSMTVAGFVRDGAMNVYAGADRIS